MTWTFLTGAWLGASAGFLIGAVFGVVTTTRWHRQQILAVKEAHENFVAAGERMDEIEKKRHDDAVYERFAIDGSRPRGGLISLN